MARKEVISNSQVFFITCVVLTSGNLISFGRIMAQVSGQDAWVNFFLPMLIAFFIGYILFKFKGWFPEKNIFEITNEVLGKKVGGLLNAWFLLYLILVLIRDLRIYAGFIGTSILQRTPVEFIILLAVTILMYFGRDSIEELARANTLHAIVFFILITVMPFMLLNEITPHYLQPILPHGYWTTINSGILQIGWFADIVVMGAFMNTLQSTKGFYISLRYAIVFSTAILTVLLLLDLIVLGEPTLARAMYPNYTLIEMIHVTDFLDRVELVLMAVWLPTFLMKTSVIFIAILRGLAAFTSTRDHRPLTLITGWFVLMLTFVSFRSVVDVMNYAMYASVIVSILALVPFLSVVGIAAFRKRKNQEQGKDKQKAKTFNLAIWSCLAGCVGSLAFGVFFGRKLGLYGMIGGIGYGLFFIGLFFFSTMEFLKLKNQVKTSATMRESRNEQQKG